MILFTTSGNRFELYSLNPKELEKDLQRAKIIQLPSGMVTSKITKFQCPLDNFRSLSPLIYLHDHMYHIYKRWIIFVNFNLLECSQFAIRNAAQSLSILLGEILTHYYYNVPSSYILYYNISIVLPILLNPRMIT